MALSAKIQAITRAREGAVWGGDSEGDGEAEVSIDYWFIIFSLLIPPRLRRSRYRERHSGARLAAKKAAPRTRSYPVETVTVTRPKQRQPPGSNDGVSIRE